MVMGWPKQSGNIYLLNTQKSVVARSTVNTQGQFTLPLPDYLQLQGVSLLFTKTSNLGKDCVGQGRAVPNAGTFQTFDVLISRSGRPLIDQKNARLNTKAGEVYSTLVFFSEENSVEGDVTCPGKFDYEFRGIFPAGWSLVHTEVRSSKVVPNKLIVRYTGDAPVRGLTWRFISQDGPALGLARGVITRP